MLDPVSDNEIIMMTIPTAIIIIAGYITAKNTAIVIPLTIENRKRMKTHTKKLH